MSEQNSSTPTKGHSENIKIPDRVNITFDTVIPFLRDPTVSYNTAATLVKTVDISVQLQQFRSFLDSVDLMAAEKIYERLTKEIKSLKTVALEHISIVQKVAKNVNGAVSSFNKCVPHVNDSVLKAGSSSPKRFIHPDELGPYIRGQGFVNKGESSVSSGNPIVNKGESSVSSGNPIVNKGQSSVSSGNPTVNNGEPSVLSEDDIFLLQNPFLYFGTAPSHIANTYVFDGGVPVYEGDAVFFTGDCLYVRKDAVISDQTPLTDDKGDELGDRQTVQADQDANEYSIDTFPRAIVAPLGSDVALLNKAKECLDNCIQKLESLKKTSVEVATSLFMEFHNFELVVNKLNKARADAAANQSEPEKPQSSMSTQNNPITTPSQDNGTVTDVNPVFSNDNLHVFVGSVPESFLQQRVDMLENQLNEAIDMDESMAANEDAVAFGIRGNKNLKRRHRELTKELQLKQEELKKACQDKE